MGMPAAFAAFWLLRMAQERWSPWQLVGVGVLIGLSTVLKPSGIVMLAAAVVVGVSLLTLTSMLKVGNAVFWRITTRCACSRPEALK